MKRIEITAQELANKHECWVAMDDNGRTYVYTEKPRKYDGFWDNGGASYSTHYHDVQWPSTDDWTQCCVGPEPAMLPCPYGGEVNVLKTTSGRWYVNDFSKSGRLLLSFAYFDTRADAIRAWNAVVREIGDE